MEHAGRYPLTGLREATTAPQLALIDRAAEVLSRDDRVLAGWLVGSFAVGEADPFSDVDLHCLVSDDAVEELRTDWVELVSRITPVVMATPFFPSGVVDWFFYMFGNLVVVVGRNEAALAMNGVITLSDTGLVPLMLAERGVRKTGGQKRLDPFLSREQQDVLLALPPLAPTIDSVIDAELAIARDFIPRGQRLARATGAVWPRAFQDATVAHVERYLGVTVL